MEQIAITGAQQLFSNGVLGIAAAGLVYYVFLLRAELKDTRAAHEIKIAEKDKKIDELQEARLTEAMTLVEVSRKFATTQEAVLLTMRRDAA